MAAEENDAVYLHGFHKIQGFGDDIVVFIYIDIRHDLQIVDPQILKNIMIAFFFAAGSDSVDDRCRVEYRDILGDNSDDAALFHFEGTGIEIRDIVQRFGNL